MRNFAIVALMLLIAGCGEPDEDKRNIIPGNNLQTDMGAGSDVGGDDMTTGSPDMGADAAVTNDAGADAGADMPVSDCQPVCDPGYDCIDGGCVLVDSCLSALDLGMLTDGPAQVVSGSLITEGVEDVVATCAGTSLRDRVITFELGFDATLDYSVTWQGQYDGVVELRTDCADDTTVVDCSDVETRTVTVPAGRYYLVLDQTLGNAGAFEVSIRATAAACTPGVSDCVGDSLRVCTDPTAPDILQCAGGCQAATCDGDSCANAITVTAGGTFVGDGDAYSSSLNYQSNASCRDSDNVPIPTPGFEVVFYLPGLQANQVVAVDAQTGDTNVNAVFIMSACGDAGTCEAAYKLSEQPDWVVPADGDYYVIIDKRQPTNNSFQYAIDIL